MTIEVETLTQFFAYGGRSTQKAADALRQRPELNASTITRVVRAASADSLVEAGRIILDTPLTDFLADAWTTREDLRRFKDPNAYPPTKISEYPLVGHEIALTRNPTVELVFNGAPTGIRFDFELKLALAIKSAVLSIRAGRVIGARVGDFQGSGSFSCADVTLAERQTTRFRLPGAASFGQGFTIP